LPLNSSLHQVQRTEFLRTSGWAGAHEIPVSGDWSQRKFFRIDRKGKTCILIQSFPDEDHRATPGHKLKDFVRISKYLNNIGLSAPEVYAQDLAHGLLLVEDFGSSDFSVLITQSEVVERDMYLLATSALKYLYRKTEFIAIDLPDYYASHIHKGHQRVVDWYMPAMLHKTNSDDLVTEYLKVWKQIERGLPQVKRRFLHGDYHPGNLMWLPERQNFRQAGFLDFQQAMMGPAPYDLVNLLEDARREVPVAIRKECLAMYVEGLPAEDRESFIEWYPVLATQFHCRVIGQAIRLAIRDQKTRLLSIIPVLRRHMVRDLAHPQLKPLKDWFLAQGVDFSVTTPIDIEKTTPFIRPDAN
jgi:aminoglycoside/choline kinase family phosphotransferase